MDFNRTYRTWLGFPVLADRRSRTDNSGVDSRDKPLAHMAFLDALRGIAVLLVLMVHAGGLVELFGSRLATANVGQRGVQLFYEVSAFALLYSFYTRREGSWGAYALRRFFRIAPLFYVSMLANFLMTVWLDKGRPLPFLTYLSGLTFLFGFHPNTINAVAPAGWSVAVESIFYVLFPVLALAVRSLRSAIVFTTFTVLGSLIVCYAPLSPFTRLPDEYRHFLWFPAELPVFALGFVVFFIWRMYFDDGEVESRSQGKPVYGERRLVSIILLLASFLIFFAGFPVDNHRLYPNSLALAVLFLGLAAYPWSLYVNPVTRYIGLRSYSIYLVHPYLARAVTATVDRVEAMSSLKLYGHYLGLVVALGVFLGGSLVVAFVTYPLELAGMAFGRRLIQRLNLKTTSGFVASKSPLSAPMNPDSPNSSPPGNFRAIYVWWLASMLGLLASFYIYSRTTDRPKNLTEAKYRQELDSAQAQIEILSAAVMENQRALKNTQAALVDANHAIVELQKRE